MNGMKHLFVLCLFLAIFTGTIIVQAETLAWWRFEEGTAGEVVSSVKDFGEDGQSEGSRSGGDVMGEPTYISTDHNLDVNGIPDLLALNMDGVDDYIPNMPEITFDLFSFFTVEAIVYWRGLPEDVPQERIDRGISMILQQSDSDDSTGRSWLFINETDSTLRSFIGGSSTIIEGVEVPANQWIYTGLTYNDGLVVLWLDTDLTDGIQPTSNSFTNPIDFEDNSAPLIIGRHKSLPDNFHGMISELRVTDSGLGDGPLLDNPPNDHLQVSQSAPVSDWTLFD